jgi:hypothetical protein
MQEFAAREFHVARHFVMVAMAALNEYNVG